MDHFSAGAHGRQADAALVCRHQPAKEYVGGRRDGVRDKRIAFRAFQQSRSQGDVFEPVRATGVLQLHGGLDQLFPAQ